MINPYKVLELDQSATADDIKKAYKRLAKKYHPDMQGGDETKFKEVAEAYERLTNPQYQHSSNGHDMFDDLFRSGAFTDMFNQRYGWNANGKAANVNMILHITLEEAYLGTKRNITVGTKTLLVTIHPGAYEGQKLKIKGYGQRGMTEDMNGDLIINIKILPHDIFYKDQLGLHTVKEISLYDAILGTEDIINVFGTNIKYVIPKGTQNAAVLRIAGKGFPIYNQEKKGDLYIRVIVNLPTELSEKEYELFNQLKQIRNESKP